jgi:hypothetical protein
MRVKAYLMVSPKGGSIRSQVSAFSGVTRMRLYAMNASAKGSVLALVVGQR